MNNKLDPILRQKQREVADLYQRLKQDATHPIAKILSGHSLPQCPVSFKHALQSSSLTVIAEIKRKSPSKGMIAPIAHPVDLAHRYIAGGANALSILTDHVFFGGHLEDLIQVRSMVQAHAIPILRKDFIIDQVQIAEAAAAGASAVLCIITAVGDKAKSLIAFARTVGIEVLVEIHTQEELNIALACGAEIIGVNNRNLNTLEVDTETALNLLPSIPPSLIKVAESGIHNPALARRYKQAGFDAVLIGEALVTSADPEKFMRSCRDD